MRTESSEPIITDGVIVDGRTLNVSVYREPLRRLPWIAEVSFRSEWRAETPMHWEMIAGDTATLARVLRLLDPRGLIAGIHVAPGTAAPPAMEARREQLRMVWEGLIGKVEVRMGEWRTGEAVP